jgi:hypothetical protein
VHDVPLHGEGCTCPSEMRCRSPIITIVRRPDQHPQPEQYVKGTLLRVVSPSGESLMEPGTRCDPTDHILSKNDDPLVMVGAIIAHNALHLGVPMHQATAWGNIAASLLPMVLEENLKGRRA